MSKLKNIKKFTGVFPPVVTVFNSNDEIDESKRKTLFNI